MTAPPPDPAVLRRPHRLLRCQDTPFGVESVHLLVEGGPRLLGEHPVRVQSLTPAEAKSRRLGIGRCHRARRAAAREFGLDGCGRVWAWDRDSGVRLTDMHCPACGHGLGQTTFLVRQPVLRIVRYDAALIATDEIWRRVDQLAAAADCYDQQLAEPLTADQRDRAQAWRDSCRDTIRDLIARKNRQVQRYRRATAAA